MGAVMDRVVDTQLELYNTNLATQFRNFRFIYIYISFCWLNVADSSEKGKMLFLARSMCNHVIVSV